MTRIWRERWRLCTAGAKNFICFSTRPQGRLHFAARLVLDAAMFEAIRARLKAGYELAAHSLSGRLLLLTLFFVMVTEGVIFLPSIASYHRALLEQHIESAEIAILPFTELGDKSLSARLRGELLARAGASAVMLKRPEQRELFLVTRMPRKIDVTIDLRHESFFREIYNALDCLLSHGNQVVHVISSTRIPGAQTVEVLVGEATIRAKLDAYARRILALALFVSLMTAVLVFFSLYRSFVRPMRRIAQAMIAFRANPEDPARIISTSPRRDEIGITERELGAMQREIYGFLQQKGRLATLGAAVAKIQHDLRNILASAQLASDRLRDSEDPVVKRLAPRLVGSIDRAVALATNTMRFGRADEGPPARRRLALAPLVAEAGEAALAGSGHKRVRLSDTVDAELEIDADPDQLYRILLNLLRNAVEAVPEGGAVEVIARRTGRTVEIDIVDNGPGLPTGVEVRLFQPFASAARSGGTGLGLAISRELARAHGGEVSRVGSDTTGTRFRIVIPDRSER